MRPIRITAALALGLALAGTAALAQQATDLGKREYDSNCASCHGSDGKGAGPFVEFLKRSPPDLTTLARRNGGVFPVARAYEVIEGAGPGHGTRDMPIWGRDYRVQAGEYYVDVPYDPAVYARTRMLALVDYLARIQAK
ncbi:MAG: c-type cytochrome [Rubrivivax sp.]|jgi:mono/diheme cytochrome c family protein